MCNLLACPEPRPLNALLSPTIRMCYFSSVAMRKLLATFLFGVLAWSFFAPLALALTANTSRLCCRRSGNHHCLSELSGGQTGDQPTAFQTVPSHCPYRLQITSPTGVGRLEALTAVAFVSPSATLSPEAEQLAFGSRVPTRVVERGPPFQHLSI
jgi:hypothetical protein